MIFYIQLQQTHHHHHIFILCKGDRRNFQQRKHKIHNKSKSMQEETSHSLSES